MALILVARRALYFTGANIFFGGALFYVNEKQNHGIKQQKMNKTKTLDY